MLVFIFYLHNYIRDGHLDADPAYPDPNGSGSGFFWNRVPGFESWNRILDPGTRFL